MSVPLRELVILEMLVEPAAIMLIACVVLFLFLRATLNRLVDLNRFVWQRPVVDLALFVMLYSLAILAMRPQ